MGINILDRIQNTIEGATETEQQSPGFPMHVFPNVGNQLATELRDKYKFSPDYIAGVMLWVISTAVGNRFALKVVGGWVAKAIVFIVLIGRAGGKKSPVMDKLSPPLEKMDKIFERENIEAAKEYKAALKRYREDKNTEEPEPPIYRKLLAQTTTTEALLNSAHDNPAGIGWKCDELADPLANLNKYNGGNDDSKLNTMFNGGRLVIDTKAEGRKVINNVFISLIGGMQPDATEQLTTKQRDKNGLFDRFLVFYPTDDRAHPRTDEEVDPSLLKDWENIVFRLLNIPYSVGYDTAAQEETYSTKVLQYTPEAKAIIQEWNAANCEEINNHTATAYRSLYSKLDTYIDRVALILQCFYYAAGEDTQNNYVDARAAAGACEVVDYCKACALRLRDDMNKRQDPTDGLNKLQRDVYEALPEKFKTGEGLTIAAGYGMAGSTFKMRFLKRKDLFKGLDHGVYQKLF